MCDVRCALYAVHCTPLFCEFDSVLIWIAFILSVAFVNVSIAPVVDLNHSKITSIATNAQYCMQSILLCAKNKSRIEANANK